MTHGRITLSGRNDCGETRIVEYNGKEIGRVVPRNQANRSIWEAQDFCGHSYGNRWVSDWNAAEALVRGLRL